ncbi:MAG: glycosyltransferase [Sulfolobaceae archaeon]
MRKLLIIASGGGHTGFARAIGTSLPFKADYVIPKGDNFSKDMLKNISNKIFEIPKWRDPEGKTSIRGFLHSLFQSAGLSKYTLTIATGSNHSILPSLFQKLKGSKIIGIESQDRFFTKGKAISIISYYAKYIFLHWEEQKRLYKNGIVVGPIVEKPKYEPKDGEYILVTAGSYGFKRLFDIFLTVRIKDKIVIQTGKVNPEPYRTAGIIAFSFDSDLEKWIANSKLVITHQGKTAMEAVVMYRKPTIIVYNRDWIRAATYQDSKKYAEVLGALFLDDPADWENSELIIEAIESVKEPKVINSGTEKAIKIILDLLGVEDD